MTAAMGGHGHSLHSCPDPQDAGPGPGSATASRYRPISGSTRVTRQRGGWVPGAGKINANLYFPLRFSINIKLL